MFSSVAETIKLYKIPQITMTVFNTSKENHIHNVLIVGIR